MVVMFHFQFLIPALERSTSPGARVVQAGYVGVSLFFVLSGFILAYTYLDPGSRMRASAAAFWQARFARVYPVYLLALVFSAPLFLDVAFFHQVGVTHLSDTVKAAVLTPLLLQAWTPKKAWMWDGPAWSLSAEAFFYLLFPILGAAVARLSSRRLLVDGLLAAGAVMIGPVTFALTSRRGLSEITPVTYGPWIAFLKFSPLVHLPEFVVGIVTGVIFLRRRERDALRGVTGWMAPVTGAMILAVLAASDRIPYLLLNGGLLAPLFAALIYGLALGRGALVRILSTRPAQLLGGASYSLYLFHLPLRNYLTKIWSTVAGALPSGIATLMFYLVVAIGLAVAIYRFVEEPARAWLRVRYAARSA